MWALYLDQQLAQKKMLRQLGFNLPPDEDGGTEPPPDFDARVAELARKYYPGDPDGESKVRQEVEQTIRFGYASLPKGEAMRIALHAVEVYAAMQFDMGLAGAMVFNSGAGGFCDGAPGPLETVVGVQRRRGAKEPQEQVNATRRDGLRRMRGNAPGAPGREKVTCDSCSREWPLVEESRGS